jgi:hypothetical protein
MCHILISCIVVARRITHKVQLHLDLYVCMNMYIKTVYTCCIHNVTCNWMSCATTQICSCMCRMPLNFSCKRQLQNPKFLVVLRFDNPFCVEAFCLLKESNKIFILCSFILFLSKPNSAPEGLNMCYFPLKPTCIVTLVP